MKITTAQSFPPPLRRLILAPQPSPRTAPGFLVGVDDLLGQNPSLHEGVSKVQPGGAVKGTPCLVVAPDQVPSVFSQEDGLDLVRAVADFVAGQIHPHLKTGVDALWLIYDAWNLYRDWNSPDKDKEPCFFKALGLTAETAGLIGGVCPGMKIPDRWANGINFVARGGEIVCQGRTPPVGEMLLSGDERADITLKLLKFAGAALDPDAKFQSITPVPLTTAKR